MSRFEEAFKGKHDALTRRMNVDQQFLIKLLDKNIINDWMKKDLSAIANDFERASMLLEKLKKQDDDLFKPFIEVLRDTHQNDVIKLLTEGSGGQVTSAQPAAAVTSSRPTGGTANSTMLMTDKHKERLRTNLDKLVEHMDSQAVLIKLVASKVLNGRDKDKVNETNNRGKQAEALIDIILLKPDSAYQGLIDALNAGEQFQLAELLSG